MDKFSDLHIKELEAKAAEAKEITLYGISVSNLPTRESLLGAFVLMDEFYRHREKMATDHMEMLNMLGRAGERR